MSILLFSPYSYFSEFRGRGERKGIMSPLNPSCSSAEESPLSPQGPVTTVFPYTFFLAHLQIHSDIHVFVQEILSESLPCVGTGTWIVIRSQSLAYRRFHLEEGQASTWQSLRGRKCQVEQVHGVSVHRRVPSQLGALGKAAQRESPQERMGIGPTKHICAPTRPYGGEPETITKPRHPTSSPQPSSLLLGTLQGYLLILDTPSECEEGRNHQRHKWSSTYSRKCGWRNVRGLYYVVKGQSAIRFPFFPPNF